jgi:hypothetical protein
VRPLQRTSPERFDEQNYDQADHYEPGFGDHLLRTDPEEMRAATIQSDSGKR